MRWAVCPKRLNRKSSWLMPEKVPQRDKKSPSSEVIKSRTGYDTSGIIWVCPRLKVYDSLLSPTAYGFHDTESGCAVLSIVKCIERFIFQSTETGIFNPFFLSLCTEQVLNFAQKQVFIYSLNKYFYWVVILSGYSAGINSMAS